MEVQDTSFKVKERVLYLAGPVIHRAEIEGDAVGLAFPVEVEAGPKKNLA